MAVAAWRDARMSVAEYRLWAEARPDHERWELLDGEPVLMSPPKARHQQIVSNLVRQLYDIAKKKGCGAYPGLAILSAAMDDYAPFPDVVVHYGPMPEDGYVQDPLIVAEVLSPSTLANDRGRKFAFYQTVPSLRTLLIVYQNEPRIEAWRRDTGWEMQVLGLDGTLDLPELDGLILVSEIYARVEF